MAIMWEPPASLHGPRLLHSCTTIDDGRQPETLE
jgi:hypothetical protein